MVWDDFYGAQANPYDVEDFELILEGLELLRGRGTTTGAELECLIERTEKALLKERGAR